MKHAIFQPVHPSWFPILEPLQDEVISTFELVSKSQYIPAMDRILAPLSTPIDEVKVVIVLLFHNDTHSLFQFKKRGVRMFMFFLYLILI